MERDTATTERLRELIAQIQKITATRELQWQRQVGSAHRFARWNNNLLILGPAAADEKPPRYLFITPFDSPDCIEVNSEDDELGPAILNLYHAVEDATKDEPAVDPFAIDSTTLDRLIHQ